MTDPKQIHQDLKDTLQQIGLQSERPDRQQLAWRYLGAADTMFHLNENDTITIPADVLVNMKLESDKAKAFVSQNNWGEALDAAYRAVTSTGPSTWEPVVLPPPPKLVSGT